MLRASFTIVVTQANDFCGRYHDRMPVIIDPANFDTWLKGDADAAAALMKPVAEQLVTCRAVNKAVGNVKNNGPELLDLVSQ